jgi:hypothetical protein
VGFFILFIGSGKFFFLKILIIWWGITFFLFGKKGNSGVGTTTDFSQFPYEKVSQEE